jgi:hypothetical protein
VNVFALGEPGADCKPGRNKFGKKLIEMFPTVS